ncbi:SNF2 domain-containing protein CLASSY 4-like [Cornus florida]|uniref:SNF2 domain-containing protein CLASSY 4-like n=1 Tax=Cornus florida TaxID=4283 RepID=UPI00289F49A5|nr:SNF2 domain-containing protein CLASSY 4-like [Cornus florida]
MDHRSCIAKRTRSQNELYHSPIAKRTRSHHIQRFFEMTKNTYSLPKTRRKRARHVSRVNLGCNEQREETKADEMDENDCDSKMEFEPKLGFNESEAMLEIEPIAKRTRSHHIQHFFEMTKNTYSLPKTRRKRARHVSRVNLGCNDQREETKAEEIDCDSKMEFEPKLGFNESEAMLEIDVDHCDQGMGFEGSNVDPKPKPKPELDESKVLDVDDDESDTGIDDPNSDQWLTSSDTDNDDPNDEDFDAASVSMEESSSSSSEEYEEENNEGNENAEKKACSGKRNRTRLGFSGKANVKKNGNQLDDVHEETVSKFKGNESDKQEPGEENGSSKAEEFDTKLRKAGDVKQAGALQDCDGGPKVFKTYEWRKGSERKKHCYSTSTYGVKKGDKESNGTSKENGKSNDKFNGDGAENEQQLGKEKGNHKEGESRKTTETKQRRVKEDNDAGLVRNNDNFRDDGVGKREKKFTNEQQLGKEKGDQGEGESRKATKTKQGRVKEDNDVSLVRNNDDFRDEGVGKREKMFTNEQQLGKEKGDQKEGESRKTTKTNQGRVKEDDDVGLVRNNDNFRDDRVGKRDKKFTNEQQLGKEKGDRGEGESRKTTKTKQGRVKEDDDVGLVLNNDNFRDDGVGKRDKKFTYEQQLGKEKGDQKEGESRKTTKTKQGRVEEDSDVDLVWNNVNFLDDGVGKRDKKSPKRKPLKGSDIFRILADSVLDKGKPLEGEAHEQEDKPSDEYTLPLIFKFEDQEPEPAEKSEFEKMVDNLFAEMDFALKSEEMGSFEHEVNDKTNVPEAETNQTILCQLGKHNLVLDEQIGIRCLHCSYVDLESKYVLPPLRTCTAKASDRVDYIGSKDFHMFDKLDFQASRDNFRDPFNHTKGTVWDIIPGIRESMYLHQQEGFEFLWKNLAGTTNLAELKHSNLNEAGGCIISHAPGTGKTRLTIIFIKTYLKLFPNFKPVIIAPASMLLTWEEEFRKWKVEFPFHNLNNPEFSGKENKTALRFLRESKCQNKDAVRMVKMYSWSKDKSILGISYSLFEKFAGQKIIKGKGKKPKKVVLDKKWRKMLLELPDIVVLDEGHTPRNHRSCIWNTLLKLRTERRIILSGTPFQNNFGELFNTLRLVRSAVAGLLAQEKTFADTISSRGGKYGRKQWRGERAISSRKIVDDAIERLKATIAPFVHVHKGSILQESLPGLRDCVILLNPPLLQKHVIERIEGRQFMMDYEYKVALASVHPSLLLHCSLSQKENSIIDHNKLERLKLDPDKGVKTRFVMELIRLSVAMNEKVLIFSQFIHPLELIKDQLREVFDWNEGREVLQMQGKLDQKHRQNMISIFNCPKGDAKVLLASIRCCSEGINLVGASRVVLLDVVWNPSVQRQAISRAYRLGQKKLVYTYHLMTAGTTEGDKYCRQAEKDRLSELVFSSTEKEKEKEKERNCTAVFNDKILDEMIGHEKLKDMFEKIVYQPKETNLIVSFG